MEGDGVGWCNEEWAECGEWEEESSWDSFACNGRPLGPSLGHVMSTPLSPDHSQRQGSGDEKVLRWLLSPAGSSGGVSAAVQPSTVATWSCGGGCLVRDRAFSAMRNAKTLWPLSGDGGGRSQSIWGPSQLTTLFSQWTSGRIESERKVPSCRH
jgi:hypothetical protein